ncbi:AlpA family transcriptional regulator [Paraburkholderia sp. BL25I1N1]|uniref:helix-turn-helix transcriptional regulator n=1 Tax=Paraburkholderia sp. BL25I1N1 TaxID=1938804 RepID=UPI000D474644|nr:AlpA family phage regulatory protein [Paraburkholderia sp. BL25I1N1]PRY03208.1 AlpA family transcriptional regulator [Paraburkholderia sp. BL25I1N1]
MKKSFTPEAVPQPAAAPVNATAVPLPRVIRMPDLQRMYPVGRTTIYELIKAGKLPRPVALSKRARGWVLAEIEECIAKLKAEAKHG